MSLTELLFGASGPFLVMFREALEAALIISIIAAYLRKIARTDLNRYLYFGTAAAIAASLLLGGGLIYLYGGLSGTMSDLFEGLASITATLVLTYMIIWMARNARHVKGDIEQKIDVSISRKYLIGIALLAFVAVAREGLETVLFLVALVATTGAIPTLMGVIGGLTTVTALAFLMMRGVYRLNLRKFFKYTSVILVVFAAGLFGYGVHELVDVAEDSGMELGVLASPAYNINPPDRNNPFHERGAIGSIFRALLGYDGNPEWLRVMVYLGYWAIVGNFLLKSYSSKYMQRL